MVTDAEVKEQPEKIGTCPVPEGAGICVELCTSDFDCDGNQKCCSNGCGHVCTAPQLSRRGMYEYQIGVMVFLSL